MSTWATTGIFLLGFVTVLAIYIGRRVLTHNPYPLPPGPPGLPFVGNVIGINTDAPWLTYIDWARMYGNIIHSRLLGKDIIIINSEKIAKDLMEKRSRNYSDRPHLIANDLYGMGFATSLLHYGDRWRLHKRLFHQTFRIDAIPRFLPVLHDRSGLLLRQLLSTPEHHLEDHVFEYTASVTLKCTYNYDAPSRKDEIMDIFAHVIDVILTVVRPDVTIILSAFPLLLYLPSWFPGMSFRKDMEMVRAATRVYLDRPFEDSLQRQDLSNTLYDTRWAADRRTEGSVTQKLQMEVLKEATGTAFVASETSTAVLKTFFLVMMMNPNAQEKAQEQIDAVVGTSRLPSIEDRPSLPFVDAIFRETLRYRPILPLSFPHVTVDDDVYDGFHIPKGSLLMANVWSMAHDEIRYPNPRAFIPERFLNDDGSLKPNDVEHITFGFGRRMCSGRHFADLSLWFVIARVLAVLKILRPLDEDGVEMVVEPKFSTGAVIYPLPFKYRIVPRFPWMDANKLDELITASVA